MLILGCQKSAQDYYNKGVEYLSNDYLDDAIEAFEKSYKINPNDTSCAMQLGKCYYQQNNYNKAINLFEKIYSSYPQKENCIYSLVECYLHSGNILKASQLADTLLKFNPEESEYYCIKGRTLLQGNNFYDSKEYLSKAILLNPTVTNGYFFLALSYSYLNNLDSAVFCAKESYALHQSYKSKFLLASLYLLKANKFELAKKEFNDIIDSVAAENVDSYEGYDYSDYQ